MSTAASNLPGTSKRSGPLRFVTAASLFDGHDAAINIMRRLIQAQGAEVIHLGHNRSVEDIVRAAIQEDADGIAVSSYQGGHMEFFRYIVDRLRALGAPHIKVFGGGGGTITPQEIQALMEYGVERIYHPHDGMQLGLEAMINDLVQRTLSGRRPAAVPRKAAATSAIEIAAMISALEDGQIDASHLAAMRKEWQIKSGQVPVIGITGTGGAGKSSVTDEILNRFLACFPNKRIAVLAVDPTRRRTGGALLGDRIRMNSLRSEQVFMRSIATRRQHLATSEMLGDHIHFLKSCGFDLVIVETAGIGQGDSEIVDHVDFSVYVMTSEYGAASQLEKIDMLDFADLIILNKFDKRGAEDALRDVRKQWKRNHVAFAARDEDVPVYPTIASQFNDPGISWMFVQLCARMVAKKGLDAAQWTPRIDTSVREPRATAPIPGARIRYLAEIAEQGRAINAHAERQAAAASQLQHLYEALRAISDPLLPDGLASYPAAALTGNGDKSLLVLRQRYQETLGELGAESQQLLRDWPARKAGVQSEQFSYTVRGREITGSNYCESLSHQKIPKIAAPEYADWGELLRFLQKENLPGGYPYTGGVYPYRRLGEDPTRMFAGEGTPERTNRRFHYLSQGQDAARLSTAFDSVTLYGEDPHERPDIYGKVGNSGVSIASVDDMKKLYSGFDLCAPTTSVSMTINGPAPMILAFFMNTAIDQQVEKHLLESGQWDAVQPKIDAYFAGRTRPRYEGELPPGNNGLGLGLLGISGDKLVDADTYADIRQRTLAAVRGTVQADILKEDQAQNTCIFSTEFAMKMMGDVQQFFIDNSVRNYYSISISGYHIAEAGANPISQLAFTLANGFTIVEYYLARGMNIDDFAPNLSFFFSNGMDPEYTVIGRVARRIWARAMRERYAASARSQMLKYHVQTSGRSLHAQEISFNDIRTTLQALYALFDNCNSLHTNAFDEAVTTPTEQSVRRAVAIQMIISRELGLNFCENPWQGSFIVTALTDLVEEAVYQEFERISDRGGVLGAMDTMYQRGRIQEESLYYESKKHDGSLPLIGVNTFLPKAGQEDEVHELELIRSSDKEKQDQIRHVREFQQTHSAEGVLALAELQAVARRRGNLFATLMETVKSNSLGQISAALYQVGGEYRRNM
ncbi:MAG: methylmalonyl-CoA mutase family protein [Gammaproteobacteria bacterium]|nr:methylmalonyl-CoA mutase family protein [Gammaproteobacteria bacterium]MDH5302573.1 methylmalonyl-CoA mutase family protein [Gammaproteobacteria bacterium]MDH5321052.1 methylmalonyl-CoA mutase family protein [Gammaproteobacteria bacterium]